MLKGYKTYLVAIIAVLTAAAGYLSGQLTLLQGLQAVGLAVGLGGNRLVVEAGAILNSPYGGISQTPDAATRQWVTYLGVAITILSAVAAALTDQQATQVTLASVLGALGLNFLGVANKRAAYGTLP